MATEPTAIVISARRAESASSDVIVERIHDDLARRYGRAAVVNSADSTLPDRVVLVVIGPRWLDHLDDPADSVREEIETALRLGVPLIPLLVEGANPPSAPQLPESLRPLLRQSALSVRQPPDFARDMERVGAAIDALRSSSVLLAPSVAPTPQRQPAAASALAQQLGLAQRGGEARASRRRAPLLTLALALVVIIGAAGLLRAGAFNGLFASTSVPGPEATQTAQTLALIRSAEATQTAQAALLATPYTPRGVGPCAPPNQHAIESYWFWLPDSPVTCEADGTTARLAPPAYLAFKGFPGYSAFPQAFTAAMTIALVGDSPQICAQVTLNLPGETANPERGVDVCGDGTWYAPNTAAAASPQPLPGGIAGPLRFTLTVTATTIALSVNGHQLLAPASYNGGIDSIEIAANGLPDDAMEVSSFSLTPTNS